MDEINLRYIEIFGPIAVAILALYFVYVQTKINNRLKKIQDYVAVSIVPDNSGAIKIMNVGKINLYLKKVEIGQEIQNYKKAILISVGISPFFIITIKNMIPNVEMPVKLYLFNEFEKKYLTEGEVAIDAIPVNIKQISMNGQQINQKEEQKTNNQEIPMQVPLKLITRAWTYKTKEYDWKL